LPDDEDADLPVAGGVKPRTEGAEPDAAQLDALLDRATSGPTAD
jgi:hypothetical protein